MVRQQGNSIYGIIHGLQLDHIRQSLAMPGLLLLAMGWGLNLSVVMEKC